ncbi:MAG: GntR family transcriptional regulator, partial [Chloroflexi bacterium]|nr:GntR family transcriptional regulator [Chloroflexota bacterium]
MASDVLFRPPPEFRPLRRDAYDALREAILLGRLQPGQRVVEAEIARHMGISRGPIREAIRQLEQDGLLEYHPRRGAVVSTLSRERIVDAYTVRAALEGLAAKLASQSLTAAGVARLAQLLDTMRVCAQQEDSDRLLQADVQFHESICELSGNRVLLRLWMSVGPHAWTLFSGAQQRGYSLQALA